jgi:molecular chaperone DnaK
MSQAYGIDFGTTNSVLARADSHDVSTIPLDRNLPAAWADLGFDRVLPSVIAFDGAAPVFGWAAKTARTGKLEAVKRLFATNDTVTVGGQKLRVEEAAGLFFRNLVQPDAGGSPVLDRAVVTVPANSRGLARLRTRVSAGLAGIDVLALINEPTAAAMAHARAIGADQRVMVFDWGGGTLDVTVLQAVEGTFIEQASKGVQRLGGLDLDAAFMASVLPVVPHAADWTDDERSQFRLELELAKVRLSERDSVVVALPTGGRIELTRQRFESAIRPLIERTREPVETCLRESPGRIDHLVMVGGTSRIPVVRRFVAGLVGVEANTDVDPMTAVAEGAAIAAGILTDVITDLDFFVGTEHALGTVTHDRSGDKQGRFSVLIGRNTKYPARSTETYRPVEDYQEYVNVEVIEGDPAKPLDDPDNVLLKNWQVALPERRRSVDATLAITYEYDVDGIIHVTVEDVRTHTILVDQDLSPADGTEPALLDSMRKRIEQLMGRRLPFGRRDD